MTTEETVEIYRRMAQILEAVKASNTALTSRTDGLELTTTEMMKNILTVFDLIEGHAANMAIMLAEMKTMHQTLTLIREDLVGRVGPPSH